MLYSSIASALVIGACMPVFSMLAMNDGIDPFAPWPAVWAHQRLQLVALSIASSI
jgi:hypothetical protein